MSGRGTVSSEQLPSCSLLCYLSIFSGERRKAWLCHHECGVRDSQVQSEPRGFGIPGKRQLGLARAAAQWKGTGLLERGCTEWSVLGSPQVSGCGGARGTCAEFALCWAVALSPYELFNIRNSPAGQIFPLQPRLINGTDSEASSRQLLREPDT